MTISFYDVIHLMEKDDALMTSGQETRSMGVIKSGVGIDPAFWDNFMSICGDSEGMAELLGVPSEKVASWSNIIQDAIDTVARQDQADSDEKNAKNIETGDPADEGIPSE